MGYLCTIRAFSDALTDTQILADHVNDLTEIESCVAWLDLGSRQPTDKSTNALPISIVGSGAKVVNLVPCSSFAGYGCATFKNKITSDLDNFTVIGKVYPVFTANSEMCIYSSVDNDAGYELLLRKLENYNYKLVFASADTSLESTAEIKANRWFDFAVTYSGCKLQIFIDGTLAGETTERTLKLKGAGYPIIGAGVKKGMVDYKKGFEGFIDYISEFDVNLPLDRIVGYVDNPPFIFDKDMISVMSLNSTEPSELACEDLIFGSGDFRYVLAEETCSYEAAKGVEYYYPTEKDPTWDTLSAEEQWKLEYYCDYVNTAVHGSLGLAVIPPGGVGIYKAGTKQLMRRNVLEWEDVPLEEFPTERGVVQNTGGTLRKRNAANQTIKNPSKAGYRRLGANGAATAGAGALGAGASGCSGSGTAAGISAGVLALGGIVAGVAVLAIYYTVRPTPKNPGLRLDSLKINTNGDSAKGSIHCRVNQATSIPAEFTDISAGDMKGVLIPKDLTNVELTIKVTNTGAEALSGQLKGTEAGGVFGDVTTAAFTINVGDTQTLSVSINVAGKGWKTSPMVQKLAGIWSWNFEGTPSNLFVSNSSHTIYTILDTPKSPFVNTDPYDATSINYVWTDLLDVCAAAYNTYKTGAVHDGNAHLAAYAKNLYSGGAFTYDRTHGQTMYLDARDKFKLQKYLTDLKSATPPSLLNCTDCAHIVSIAGLASGIECCVGRIRNTLYSAGIVLNQIIGIGSTTWGSPFTNGSMVFSYHDIAFADGLALDKDSLAFDACLQIDSGEYPGKDASAAVRKIPLIPTQYVYSVDDLNNKVDVPDTAPYTLQFYRQRLVKDAYDCNKLFGYAIVNISDVITAADSLSVPISRELWAGVMNKLNLVANPIPAFSVDNIERAESRFTPNADLGERVLVEDLDREKVWNVRYDKNEYKMTVFESLNSDESYMALLHYLSNIAYPEINSIDLTDTAFAVGDTLVIFAVRNLVVQISGKNCQDYAKKMIHSI
jgi:hypothetical protein